MTPMTRLLLLCRYLKTCVLIFFFSSTGSLVTCADSWRSWSVFFWTLFSSSSFDFWRTSSCGARKKKKKKKRKRKTCGEDLSPNNEDFSMYRARPGLGGESHVGAARSWAEDVETRVCVNVLLQSPLKKRTVAKQQKQTQTKTTIRIPLPEGK